ncbi:MAG: hypothetical protein DIU78_016080 [Pseudomonadota bacterium]|nr:MAG: hypothetical protein DIU78_11825 [Pseudomonadota bacterium]
MQGTCAAALVVSGLLAAGCAQPRVADPSATVRAYVDAARRGDADALYALLSKRSQRDLGLRGTRRLVQDARVELRKSAEALEKGSVEIEAIATIPYDDGERAVLELEEGVFRIGSVDALPAAARTPQEALGALRRALSRRSYAAFVRLLSSEMQSALERDLDALVRGLEDPETLDVRLQGDRAEVELAGGHVVKLRRELGVWRIEDVQ